MSRKNIGNKLRFEVLKRDKFVCQYCGKGPPDIKVNVDHIKPVASGGNNDIENLITSCFECNSGKGTSDLLGYTVSDESISTVAKVLFSYGICNDSGDGFDMCTDVIESIIVRLVRAHGYSYGCYSLDCDVEHAGDMFDFEIVNAIAELLAIAHGVNADIIGAIVDKIRSHPREASLK